MSRNAVFTITIDGGGVSVSSDRDVYLAEAFAASSAMLVSLTEFAKKCGMGLPDEITAADAVLREPVGCEDLVDHTGALQ